MTRFLKLSLIALLISVMGVSGTQSQPSVIAPNVFLRGIQTANGVRYTAAIIKPSDDAAFHNLSVEITLPANAAFTEMLVSRQIEFDVIRRNAAGQLTMIWQISRVPNESPLDSFSFTVAEPLVGEVEFYAQWVREDNALVFENFLEQPPIIVISETEAQTTLNTAGFFPVGSTGVQAALSQPTAPLDLSFRVLPTDFNPPAEFGDIWWCSLLEVVGLPERTLLDVIVPLRRPLAPFTPLVLFQQQPDGSWLLLAEQGIVTADGQFVMYTHPGGIVATGGPSEIQPEIIPVTEAVIEVAVEVAVPPTADPAAVNNSAAITDGTSNTISFSEAPVSETNAVVPVDPVPVVLATLAPLPTDPAPLGGNNLGQATATTASITDGSSNTIQFGEPTAAPPTIIAASPVIAFTAQIRPDGTLTASPVTPPTTTGITDGSSNTLLIGENTATTVPLVTATSAGITDGSSNTLLIGESTATPTTNTAATPVIAFTAQIRPGGTATPTGITDGSSNTLLIGESTATPMTNTAATPVIAFTAQIRPDGTLTPSPVTPPTTTGITDGSSNTLLIGENTATPTTNTAATPVIAFTAQIRPEGTATPTGITDGSSNTLLIGENTATPQVLVQQLTPTVESSIVIVGGSTLTSTVEVLVQQITSTPTADENEVTISPATATPQVLVQQITSTALVDVSGSTATSTAVVEAPTDVIAPTASPTSEAIVIVENTLAPEATATPVPTNTPLPTPTLEPIPPTVVPTIVIPNPFGAGGVRVEVFTNPSGTITQCQTGRLMCVDIARTAGTGVR